MPAPARPFRPQRAASLLRIAQPMLAEAMPELVIAQAERLGGLALVPAVAAEVVLEDRPFVRFDRGAQVLDGLVVVRDGTRGRRRSALAVAGRARRGGGAPGAVERVELGVGDRGFPIGPAIDRALDD